MNINRSSRRLDRLSRRGWRAAGRRFAAIGIAGLLALSGPAAAVVPNASTVMAQEWIGVGDIVDNPDTYYGANQRVTVGGMYGEELGPRSFTIMDPQFGGEIPVVVRGELPTNIQNQNLQIMGTVHQFNLAAFENQLGLDLNDPNWMAFRGRPALIATTVTPGSGMQQGQAQQGQQNQRSGAAAGGATTNVNLAQILNNPSAYYSGQNDHPVTITGVVGQQIGPRSFTLTDQQTGQNGHTVPVVIAGQMPSVAQGQHVQVQGTVHQFNINAFENRLGLDLDDRAWTNFRGQPAMIATSVTPTNWMQQGQQQTAATVDEITDNSTAFYGKQVTVTGDLNDVYGPRSFSVSDQDALFDENLLVVSTQQVAGLPGLVGVTGADLSDRYAQITGTVRPFAIRDMENELGLDFDDNALRDFEGQPVIVASNVNIAVDDNSAGFGTAGEGLVDSGAAAGATFANATVDSITDDPFAYAGQRVSVTGEVGDVHGVRSFTVEDSDLLFDEHLLVLSATPIPGLHVGVFPGVGVDPGLGTAPGVGDAGFYSGDDVRVSGRVMVFNIVDVERELGFDLDDTLYADWDGKAAIIATTVVPVVDDGFGF